MSEISTVQQVQEKNGVDGQIQQQKQSSPISQRKRRLTAPSISVPNEVVRPPPLVRSHTTNSPKGFTNADCSQFVRSPPAREKYLPPHALLRFKLKSQIALTVNGEADFFAMDACNVDFNNNNKAPSSPNFPFERNRSEIFSSLSLPSNPPSSRVQVGRVIGGALPPMMRNSKKLIGRASPVPAMLSLTSSEEPVIQSPMSDMSTPTRSKSEQGFLVFEGQSNSSSRPSSGARRRLYDAIKFAQE
jgi:hypothetical protein